MRLYFLKMPTIVREAINPTISLETAKEFVRINQMKNITMNNETNIKSLPSNEDSKIG